jgi:hypothetical protein
MGIQCRARRIVVAVQYEVDKRANLCCSALQLHVLRRHATCSVCRCAIEGSMWVQPWKAWVNSSHLMCLQVTQEHSVTLAAVASPSALANQVDALTTYIYQHISSCRLTPYTTTTHHISVHTATTQLSLRHPAHQLSVNIHPCHSLRTRSSVSCSSPDWKASIMMSQPP